MDSVPVDGGEAVLLGEPPALGVGELAGVAVAAGFALPPAAAAASRLELAARPWPPDPAAFAPRAPDDGVGETAAFAEDFLLLLVADGVADPDGLADGDGVGVADGVGAADGLAAGVVRFGATSSTWRNRSSAVLPTRLSTCCAPLPGTATVMMSGPCCWTWAPVKPAPLTRFRMIDLASFIAVWLGAFLESGVTAFSVTVVPLDRSRPRPILKFLCQLPGCAAALPMIPASMMTTITASAAIGRQGRDNLVLGGATSRCP